MNIFILMVVSVLLTIGSWCYLHIVNIEKENRNLSGIINAVKDDKFINIYSIITLVVLVGLGIELELIYKNNLLIWNIKLLVLTGIIFPACVYRL